jgi:predicted  nucleic acid-binding Zn-ribbon protein
MRSNSRDTLQKALDKDELCVEDLKGELAVGNRRELDILQDLASLKQKQEKHYDETMQQKARINAVEACVEGLSSSVDGYRNLRGRFNL